MKGLRAVRPGPRLTPKPGILAESGISRISYRSHSTTRRAVRTSRRSRVGGLGGILPVVEGRDGPHRGGIFGD